MVDRRKPKPALMATFTMYLFRSSWGGWRGRARTRDLVFGDTVRPEGDEEVATGAEFSRPDTFLRMALCSGAMDTLHSLLLPIDSPGTETNVVPVCTSNISTFVLSAHTLAGCTHPTSAVLSDAGYFAKRVTLSLALRSSGDAGRGFRRVRAAAALVAG
jgi:hypothetical protein